MRNFFALISGGLFGSGLIVAGVTDAYVIHGWLDIFDQWTPQLGFFFVASAGVMAIGWRLAKIQTHSLLGEQMPQIINGKMDFSLVLGSILFGIGWGLAGICPGPSLAALSFGGSSGMQFVGAMIAGMMVAVPIKNAMRNIAVLGRPIVN